jgi:hypothetical protein
MLVKIKLFDPLFFDQCAEHDIRYELGGNELHRLWSDVVFAWDLFIRIITLFLTLLAMIPIAILFIISVLIGGWASFNYRNRNGIHTSSKSN